MVTDRGWIDEEKSKIRVIESKLNPSLRMKYQRELSNLDAMLDLLGKTKTKIPPKKKKRIERQITNVMTGLRMSMIGIDPNMEELPEEAAQRAKLVKAAAFMSDLQDTELGLDEAERFLAADPKDTSFGEPYETADTRDFVVDRELSRMSGAKGQERILVVTNPKTKKVEIAIRGTKFRADKNVEPYEGFNPARRIRNFIPTPDAHTAEDLQHDYDIMMTGRTWNPFSSSRNVDSEVRHAQRDTAKNVVERAKAKYPEFEPHIPSHSLGSNVGIDIGNQTGVNTTNFNPHLMGRNILNGSTHPRDIMHKIYRTNKDIPSILSGAHKTEFPDNYEVNILPVHSEYSRDFSLRDPKTWTGLNDAHRLNNFVFTNGGRETIEQQRNIMDAQQDTLRKLNKVREYQTLNDMIDFHNNFDEMGSDGLSPDEYEEQQYEDLIDRRKKPITKATEEQVDALFEEADNNLKQAEAEGNVPQKKIDEARERFKSHVAEAKKQIRARAPEPDLGDGFGGVGGDIPEGFTRRPTPRPSAKRNIFYDDEEESLYQQSREAKPSDELETLNATLGDETPEEWSKISKREIESARGTPQEADIIRTNKIRTIQHARRQQLKGEDIFSEPDALPRTKQRATRRGNKIERAQAKMSAEPELFQPIKTTSSIRRTPFGELIEPQGAFGGASLFDEAPELFAEPKPEPAVSSTTPDLDAQLDAISDYVDADFTEPPSAEPSARQGEGWFSKFARHKGYSIDDRNKFLYEQSLQSSNTVGNKDVLSLTDNERSIFDPEIADNNSGLSKDEINEYVNGSAQDRDVIRSTNDREAKEQTDLLDQMGNTEVGGQGNRLKTAVKSFGDSFGEQARNAVSAKGLAGMGAGFIVGGLVNKGMNTWIDPNKKLDKLVYHGDDLVSAGLTGSIMAKGLGQSMGYGGLIGIGSAALGIASEEGTDYGLQKLGVSKPVSTAVGAGVGGAVSGGSAVALGLMTAAGAEEGASVGALGGPAGIALGALVGAGIGVAAHYIKFPWDKDPPPPPPPPPKNYAEDIANDLYGRDD